MNIVIKTTAKEYNDFYKYYFFKRKQYLKIFILFLVTLLISSNEAFRQFHYSIIFLISFFILGVVFFCLFFLFPYLITIYQGSNFTKKFNVEHITIFMSDQGFVNMSNENILFTWKQIQSVGLSDMYVFIRLFNNRFFLIPKYGFATKDAYKSWVSIFEEEVKYNRTINARHLYYWGLLGLVPNVGLVTGFILLYKGISQYRDKFLILIGLIDILFTPLFWYIFVQLTKHT